jgi:hypothetical protein
MKYTKYEIIRKLINDNRLFFTLIEKQYIVKLTEIDNTTDICDLDQEAIVQ